MIREERGWEMATEQFWRCHIKELKRKEISYVRFLVFIFENFVFIWASAFKNEYDYFLNATLFSHVETTLKYEKQISILYLQ